MIGRLARRDPPGIDFRCEGPTVPYLRLLAAGQGRFALVMDSSVVFFGRIGEEWWGLDLLLSRRDQRVDVVPPIPSSAARALGTDVARWSHWFLERLRQSDACPLHAGQWTLYAFDWSELVPDVDVVKANEFLLRWLSSDLMRYDEQGQASFDYGSHRAGATGVPVVPTRTLSRPDTARVKAMRRLAREGALPPLLVWEVSGVQGVLILDGHDRLVAGLAEGVPPEIVVLARVDPGSREAWHRAVVNAYQSTMDHLDTAEQRGGEVGKARVAAAHVLVRALGLPDHHPTRAWPLQGGADTWTDSASHVSASWVEKVRWTDEASEDSRLIEREPFRGRRRGADHRRDADAVVRRTAELEA